MPRRDILRVGGSSLLGLSLAQILELQQAKAATNVGPSATTGSGPGWNKAKSVIMVYLQGGPSHLDLWDPKDNVPDNVRSVFKQIPTKLPGVNFTEIMPKLAQINDKMTMIRRQILYRIVNHTAAHQMHTGTDRQGQPCQLGSPSPKDFPTFGLNITALNRRRSPCCRSSCCRGHCKKATGGQGRTANQAAPRSTSIRPATTWI
jgi:hypothetical protein